MNRMVQAVQVPRSKLKHAGERDEVESVGVYFLFGKEEGKAKPAVYIGEAENCFNRLKQHHKRKDFWNVSVIVRSRTNRFTKAHVKFLERYCHERADEAGRYRVMNSSIPSRPHISEPVQADLVDNFDTIRVLVSTLGFPLFDKISEPASSRVASGISQTQKDDKPSRDGGSREETSRETAEGILLICKGRGATARGEYVEDGLVVFQDSTAALQATEAAPQAKKIRTPLKQEGTLQPTDSGDALRFTRDHVFSSPSAAARAVLGRSANGWKEWEDEKGRTLHELERE